ncbi:MAG: DUF5914 domain-containing protein [Myxococcota bacterium]
MIRRLQAALSGRRLYIGRRPPEPIRPALRGPDWVQADPERIDRALQRALARPTGGWYAVDASHRIDGVPRAYDLAGRRLVLWRGLGRLLAAPEACPHLGASLAGACVRGDAVVCPWHGLPLGSRGHGDAWRHLPTHDDGVLAWVRLDESDQEPTDAPILPTRPRRFIDSVIRMEAACAPEDVIANRLDPWHGAHYHPHTFQDLVVFDAEDDVLRLRVTFRIAGPLCIEVDAAFHCPEPRTIVMTIEAGDGVGSVVETHATPLGAGRTAILEATLATSDRAGFDTAARLAPLFRPFMRMAARRLWVEDAAYAERRAWLRARGRA